MIVEYACIVCGIECKKSRSPGNMKTLPKFCSQKCSGLFKSLNKKGTKKNFKGICENCKKPFETYKSPSRDNPRFCSINCLGESQEGSKNPSYNGGKYKSCGYYVLFMPNHPYRTSKNLVYEHRYVMECKMGRYLKPEEVVHHIDGNKLNNDPKNLMLFKNQSEHLKHHRKNG